MSCPYCAKKIIEERLLVIDSFDKALLKVIHWQGKEILKNKTRLLAYLFDLFLLTMQKYLLFYPFVLR